MGAAGAVLLLAGDATFPAEAWLGFACALAAAFVWALYSVLAARLGSVPSEAVAGFCLASGILAGLAHLALEPPAALDARQWRWWRCWASGRPARRSSCGTMA